MAEKRRTLYEILNVPPDATIEEITEAYRRLVKEKVDDPQAFDTITQAYMTLANPETRERYDEELRRLGEWDAIRDERPAEPAVEEEGREERMVTCPSCGHRNEPEHKYCSECGFLLVKFTERAAGKQRGVKLGIGKLSSETSAETYSLTEPRTVLGRRLSNDIVISGDKYVSGRHAAIYCDMGAFFIEDLGSTNGTFVNEKRVPPGERVRLHDGDLVRLGRSRFKFEIV